MAWIRSFKAASLIALCISSAPAIARESIVGNWANSAAACAADEDGVKIEPKTIVFQEDSSCTFKSVSRSGNVVRWTDGVCMRGANNAPTDRNVRATASLEGNRLTLRIDAAQVLLNETLVRCTRRR